MNRLKCVQGKSGFLYVTSLNNRYYDLPDSFENIQRFKIPKLTRIEMPKSDLQLLKNYKLQFVDGLRQNTIRNQNTKFKTGSLPLRAYASDNHSHTPINTHSIFSSEDSEPTSEEPIVAEDTVLYGPQSVLVLHDLSEQLGKIADVSESQLTEQLNRMPDVFIGVTKHPVKVNDTESNLEFFF